MTLASQVQHTHPSDPPLNPATFNSPWRDPAVVERAASLWVNHTAAQIAQRLNIEFGLKLTRSGVTAKLDRLGLLTKGGPRRTPAEQLARKKERDEAYNAERRARRSEHLGLPPKPDHSAAPALRVIEIEPLNISLADLPDNGCRYIPGDDLLYCGHPRRDRSSYCPSHHALVWIAPQVRRRV